MSPTPEPTPEPGHAPDRVASHAPVQAPELDQLAQVVVSTLDGLGLEVEEVDEHRWMTMLAGEWKRTIPVLLALGARSLQVTSLLAGRPDDNHGAVHELLLHRNEGTGWVHFALDDEGDIVLTGRVPLAALTAAALDELLGEVLALSDETFNSVLRTGFADYIAVEQAWRAANDMPPNPVSTQG